VAFSSWIAWRYAVELKSVAFVTWSVVVMVRTDDAETSVGAMVVGGVAVGVAVGTPVGACVDGVGATDGALVGDM
jgi:hypothetical protein